MKTQLKIKTKDLITILTSIGSSIDSKKAWRGYPVAGCCLMTIKPNELSVEACDSINMMRLTIDLPEDSFVKGYQPVNNDTGYHYLIFEIAVLKAMLKGITSEYSKLEYSDDKPVLKVTPCDSQKINLKLNLLTTVDNGRDEYPAYQEQLLNDKLAFSLCPIVFSDAIKPLINIPSKDETKRILTCINCKISPEELMLMATDGRMAVVNKVELKEENNDCPDKPETPYEFNFPASFVKMLINEVSYESQKVNFHVSNGEEKNLLKVSFSKETKTGTLLKYEIGSRLMVEEYPNIIRLFPESHQCLLRFITSSVIEVTNIITNNPRINTSDLINLFFIVNDEQYASLLLNGEWLESNANGIVDFLEVDYLDNKEKIPILGEESAHKIDGLTYKGLPFIRGSFTLPLFKTCLDIFKDDEITLGIEAPDKPFVWIAERVHSKLTCLLMPVFKRSV